MISRFTRLLCLAGWMSAAFADTEESLRQAALLNRVRSHMQQALVSLPNYTCLETIERVRRKPKSRRFDMVDTVRLEVALVDGKELFSWPGERKFDDREISDLVKGGAIGNGSFALHAKSIFMGNSARFDFIGERFRDDRKTLRWDYDVPQFQSGYQLRVGPRKAVVGYRGSFWVDAETLDLIRLEVEATDIPPSLEILETKDAVEYQRVKIGEQDFLLPRSAELRMKGIDSYESINRTTFAGCRQYTGESKLLFSDPTDTPEEKPAITSLTIPAGLYLDMQLETPIDSEKSAVGDPVTAFVTRPVKHRGEVLIPKGAIVHGRLTQIRRQQSVASGWSVSLRFFEIEHGNARGPIAADLERLAMNNVVIPAKDGLLLNPRRRIFVATDPSLGGTALVKNNPMRLPRGLRMFWRTLPVEAESETDRAKTDKDTK
ncbi:MAG TPA: hypothetical protein VE621_01535 [Bryobacteraceae bacterium]|nr:hypothetical protein [Bryobacteraceae bacterium]